MALIKFKTSKGVLYINPEKVTSIYRNEFWTNITLGSDSVSVKDKLELVVERINNKK